MKIKAKQQKKLTEALRKAHPERSRKWAAKESKRMVRKAGREAEAAVKETAPPVPLEEDLAALPADQLASRIYRTA